MRDLNYNHLRYFWLVAHEGNLTRAAASLNLSQSAVSVQISKLEERLGHPLFERKGRRLHLTEAGRIALDHADTIFGVGRDLLATLSRTDTPRRVLRVGALATLSRNFQIEFVRPVLSMPDVELVLRSGNSTELLRSLETLGIDVVLTNRIPEPDTVADFMVHRLSDQGVGVIGTPSRIESARSLAGLLGGNPMIVPTAESPVRLGFNTLCSRLRVVPVIAAEVDDMAMMRLLAREDIGLAVIPPIVVRNELASGLLKEAGFDIGLTESFYAVTVRRKFPNPLLAGLLDRSV